MVSDPLQNALHSAAAARPLAGSLAAFAASALLFVLAAGLGAATLRWAGRVTWALAARVVIAGTVAAGLALALGHLVPDVRPYLVGRYTPLTPVSADNGFPSDHTLAAALLTGFAGWVDRRLIWVFTAGTLAVALGRLAVGAHHTLDVLGSVLIAAAALGLAGALRLPGGWSRRVLPWAPR